MSLGIQVGFMLIDAVAKSEGVELNRLQHNAAVARVILNNKKVVLVKPLTFMNNSGESVGKLARFYKVKPWAIPIGIPVHDSFQSPNRRQRLPRRLFKW